MTSSWSTTTNHKAHTVYLFHGIYEKKLRMENAADCQKYDWFTFLNLDDSWINKKKTNKYHWFDTWFLCYCCYIISRMQYWFHKFRLETNTRKLNLDLFSFLSLSLEIQLSEKRPAVNQGWLMVDSGAYLSPQELNENKNKKIGLARTEPRI